MLTKGYSPHIEGGKCEDDIVECMNENPDSPITKKLEIDISIKDCCITGQTWDYLNSSKYMLQSLRKQFEEFKEKYKI